MKTLYKVIFFATMLAMIVGCKKDEMVFEVSQYELTAIMEDDGHTKTTLSSLQNGIYYPLWSFGDVIAVYVDGDKDPVSYTLVQGEGRTDAVFSGPKAGSSYVAIYPFSAAGEFVDGTVSLTLPAVQNYVADSFGPDSYPMIAQGTSDYLSFKNLCSVMKISITGETVISSITLQAKDKNTFLSGAAEVGCNYDESPQLRMLGGGSNTVRLECGGVELDKDRATDFYISIPAQTYKGGFDIIIETIASTIVNSVSSDLEFKRARIRHLKGMDLKPDYYTSSDYSLDGTYVQLQRATEGNGIDIVLMGDGYSDRQIAEGSYFADMLYVYDNLFTKEPYKSFSHLFNVTYVNVVSATEGFEYSKTALSCEFGEGTQVSGNNNAVFSYTQKVIGASRMDDVLMVVVLNSDRYAGTCWMYYPSNSGTDYGKGPAVAYFPKGGGGDTFAELLHHEANGHGFSKLADEYAYESNGTVSTEKVESTKSQQSLFGWWKNVDFTNDPAQVRWKKFLEDSRYSNEGLGMFEGGLTYWSGVWRPTVNSIMNDNRGSFNAPSREAIYYKIHKLAYGSAWEYDFEKFAEYDAVNCNSGGGNSNATTKVVPLRPLPLLHPPVVVEKSWTDVVKCDF